MFATGRQPFAVAVGDVNGDGMPDIVTANAFDSTVSVLMGNGNGTFQTRRNARRRLPALFGRGGRLDRRRPARHRHHRLRRQQRERPPEPGRRAVRAAGDASPPIKSRSRPSSAMSTATAGPTWSPSATTTARSACSWARATARSSQRRPAAASGLSDTPLFGDLNGDGIADTVVLDHSGNILFRAGLPGTTGAFAPPVILNPGRPARAITVIQIGSQLAIAAADAHFDATLSAVDRSICLHRFALHDRARRASDRAPSPSRPRPAHEPHRRRADRQRARRPDRRQRPRQ